jgi:dethiobiotin synthetase
MPGLFVTATGTDVGKTFVTAGLIRAGRRAGLDMDALKPVLTGYDPAAAAASDAGVLLEALGRPVTPDEVARLSPWRYAAPLSPNMAAALEGRGLEFAAIVAACRAALSLERLTFIEGIGGVMVPLDDRRTVLDLIAAVPCPVVLVAGSYLGTLSHCLTAYAALRAIGRPPRLVVINESAASDVPLAATRDTLAAFCGTVPIAVVPRRAGDAVFDNLLQQAVALAT